MVENNEENRSKLANVVVLYAVYNEALENTLRATLDSLFKVSEEHFKAYWKNFVESEHGGD